MRSKDRLYVRDRDEWRAWLTNHHRSTKGIWLVYYKKHTGKSRIPYDDAVEEALCFGWIDSTVKRLDDERYIQRFSPRRRGSTWAISNIRRVKKMIRRNKMTPAGLELYRPANKKETGMRSRIAPQTQLLPGDLKRALNRSPRALENFRGLAPSHRKIYIGWLTAAKRPETRQRRIKKVVAYCEKKQKPGML